MNKTKTMTQKL